MRTVAGKDDKNDEGLRTEDEIIMRPKKKSNSARGLRDSDFVGHSSFWFHH